MGLMRSIDLLPHLCSPRLTRIPTFLDPHSMIKTRLDGNSVKLTYPLKKKMLVSQSLSIWKFV